MLVGLHTFLWGMQSCPGVQTRLLTLPMSVAMLLRSLLSDDLSWNFCQDLDMQHVKLLMVHNVMQYAERALIPFHLT